MTSRLHQLRDWITVADAAAELSVAFGESVSRADVLRLAIDGQLRLSVYLPTKVTARCQRVEDDVVDTVAKDRVIQGLCDVPMLGRAKLQIEHEYQWASGRFVPINGPVGALVKQGDFVCKLPADEGATGFLPRSQSEFPQASVLAVARTALEEFIAEYCQAEQVVKAETLDRPLEERERATLLTIIAALAKVAGIDVSRASKASEAIEVATEGLGARVSARTIENHLKRIPDAIERRGKTSS